MTKRIDRWQNLSLTRKVYIVALVIAAVGPFLPWFSDKSELVAGDTFLGLAGPTSFIGLSIFVLTSLALMQEVYLLWKDRTLLGERLSTWIYNGLGFFNLYLLGLSASVFLHPTVGSNLLAKHFVWGFYVTGIANFFLILGIMLKKSKPARPTERSRSVKKQTSYTLPAERLHQPIEQPVPAPSTSAPAINRAEELKGLKVEDVVPQSVATNVDVKKHWEHQRELEHKFDHPDEDPNIF